MISKKLDGLQAVRAFAAVSVLLFHGSQIAQNILGFDLLLPLVDAGFAGVDIFFVLSGFIIAFTADPTRTTAREFWILRAVRIYPVYWIVTAVLLMAYAVAPSPGQAHKADPLVVLGSILLLPQRQYVVGVAWTLFYEMLFYTLFAVTYFRRRILLDYIFLGWAIAICAAQLAQGEPSAILQMVLDPIVLEFYLGIIVARYFPSARVCRRSAPLFLLGCVAFAGSWVIYAQGAEELRDLMSGKLRLIFFGVPSALVLTGLLHYQGKVPRLAVALGDATYSIYLLHGSIIASLMTLAVRFDAHRLVPVEVVVLFCFLGALVGSYLFYRAIEHPTIDFVKRCIKHFQALKNGSLAPSLAKAEPVNTTRP